MKNSTGMKIINYGLKIYGEQELLLFQSEGSFFSATYVAVVFLN